MDFRKVTAIIRPEKLEAVEHALSKLNVPGISVSKVKGFGEYKDFYQSDWLCSHVRVEVFIGVEKAEAIAEVIMDNAHTGDEGDGIIAVLPVESAYHIRTRQKCSVDVCD